MSNKFLFSLELLLFCAIGFAQVIPRPGMTISQTTTFKPDTYQFASDSLGKPILIIQGNNITVDFNGIMLNGAKLGQLPDSFKGLAILVKNSRNVTIKNLQARGYKVALLAENVDSLQVLNSDLSYNYRQRLYSIRERENFQDWMSYHQNEKDEWLRYGAAVYLKNCNNALIRGLRVTQGQNGIMMTNCKDGLFYNNIIDFNSAIGIGMYRSSGNKIMHNQLNFNVRGYSHGFYARGQDSAGILVYEQSNNNVFAYNSATHSGDGFFLWAGQHTMDTGEGGCNGNLLYANDFSYAPTNGIEVTFSSNKLINNKLTGCTYGIWGGYSFNTHIAGNFITNNKYGIAIEHGQFNTIEYNSFTENGVGIQLFERLTQPGDWGYANKRDIKSHDYDIRHNVFYNDSIPLKISHSTKVAVNDDNYFTGFKKLVQIDAPNEQFYLVKNTINGTANLGDAPTDTPIKNRMKSGVDAARPQAANTNFGKQFDPLPLPDARIPSTLPGDRSLMRINEWGPYNFEYPSVWLDTIDANEYHFTLLAPPGDWKVKRAEGYYHTEIVKTNQLIKLLANKDTKAEFLLLELEFVGNQEITTQLGEAVPAGKPMLVRFTRSEKPLDWQVRWYAYTDATDPLKNYPAFQQLQQQPPLHTAQVKNLAYVWWNKPAETVPTDRFATFATTEFTIAKGKYKLLLTSDDGVKLYLDGKLVVDRWNVHESLVDEYEVELNGKHTIMIEHFDAAGFANLELHLEKIW